MAENGITLATRACTKCGVEKPLSLEHFPPHKQGRFGLSPHCRVCKRAEEAIRRTKPGYAQAKRAWRLANQDKIKETRARCIASGAKAAHDAAYRAAHKERLREVYRLKMRRRRAQSVSLRISHAIGSQIRIALRRRKLGQKANVTWRSLVGYTAEELVRHLERQFVRGMSWDNYGDWHIDHVIPVSSFQITGRACPELRRCWALPNLRPLWAAENIHKSNRRLTLL